MTCVKFSVSYLCFVGKQRISTFRTVYCFLNYQESTLENHKRGLSFMLLTYGC